MRQIYNAESPASSMHTSYASLAMDGNGNDTITSTAAVIAALDTLQTTADSRAAAAAAAAVDNGPAVMASNAGTGTNVTADLIQCLANCANASRLSLANLFPSRFENSFRTDNNTAPLGIAMPDAHPANTDI